MTESRRIATNTLASYFKLIVFALTGLFAVPVALRTLGATDYGIFSVVGGCLAFLTFVNISLANGAQRHIAFALGQGDTEEAGKWFTTVLIVHVVLAIAIAGAGLSASDWILHRVLTLPASRLAAATWIYRMVIITMVCDVVSTPYEALLVAHESIASISLINAVSGVFFMVSVFFLRYLPGDALLWYAAIYCLFQVSVAAGPSAYCYYRYPESRVSHFTADQLRRRLGELLGYSGWNLVLVLTQLVRVQGPALVLNMFFGPIANAAYGLAVQVHGFASNFVWGFLGSATPPIVKRQAAGDYGGMARLSHRANTYGFAILWIILAPVVLQLRFCLKLWLRTPPPNTAAFLAPVLTAIMVDQLTLAYAMSLVATGRMAAVSLVVSAANSIGVAAGYFLLRAGMPATWLLWAVVMGTVLAGGGRLLVARAQARISVRDWLRAVLLPSTLCVLASTGVLLTLIRLLPEGLARLALLAVVNCAEVCLIIWFLGTTPGQRSSLRTFVFSFPVRLARKPAAQAPEVAEETLFR